MGDLMCDQMTATAGIRIVLAGAEKDVLADGEGARVQRLGGLARGAVVMQANIAEIAADVAFQVVAHRSIQALGGPFAHLLDRVLNRCWRRATLGAGAGGSRAGLASLRFFRSVAGGLRRCRAAGRRRSAGLARRCIGLARALHGGRRCRLAGLRFGFGFGLRRLGLDRRRWCGLGGLGSATARAQLRTRFRRRGLLVVGLFRC
jgi:hypothetical protein